MERDIGLDGKILRKTRLMLAYSLRIPAQKVTSRHISLLMSHISRRQHSDGGGGRQHRHPNPQRHSRGPKSRLTCSTYGAPTR